MGFCPYYCVFCGTVEDNGWGFSSYNLSEVQKKNKKCWTRNDYGSHYDNYGLTPDICLECVMTIKVKGVEDDENNEPNLSDSESGELKIESFQPLDHVEIKNLSTDLIGTTNNKKE